MEFDAHGLTLDEAREDAIWRLQECAAVGDGCLVVVHGYQHGNLLKQYFRSREFEREAAVEGILVRRARSQPNPGATTFVVPARE